MSSSGAKTFVYIVLALWLCIVLIDRTAPLLLPAQTYYFRAWEYLHGHHGLRRKNTEFTVEHAHGDLGNMLGVPSWQSKRTITATADHHGFRNKETTAKDADVWIVGQSFMGGAGNSDEHTLQSQIEQMLEVPVFAYTPGNISELLSDPLLKEHQPTVVIWGIVERNLIGSNAEIQKLYKATDCLATKSSSKIDPWKRMVKHTIFVPSEYVRRSIVRIYAVHIFKRMRFAITGGHVPQITLGKDGMIFLTKTVNLINRNIEQRGYGTVVTALQNANICLADRNIHLIFLPIPDKVSVYPEYMNTIEHRSTKHPLLHLHTVLTGSGIQSVDLYSVFTNAKHDTQLYWKDDTHWNRNGITLTAKHLYDKLQNTVILKTKH